MLPTLLIPLALAGVAGAAGTTLTVQNLPPEIVDAEVVFHGASQRFQYEVHTRDGNGLLDLDHIVIHFFDGQGPLWSHHDPRWHEDGTGDAAVWTGTTGPATRAAVGPIGAHVEVLDGAGGASLATAAVTVAPTGEPPGNAAMLAGEAEAADRSPIRGKSGAERPTHGALAEITSLTGATMVAAILGRSKRRA